MDAITAETIALKCINVLELLPEEESVTKLSQLADGKAIARWLTFLKDTEFNANDGIYTVIPVLKAILGEHFTSGDSLVDWEQVCSGTSIEITKLVVLLLYISCLSEKNIRNKLTQSHSLNVSAQTKLTYLFESLQRRGSGLSQRFLQVLVTENLDGKGLKNHNTSYNGSPVLCFSPNGASSNAPLRDFVQSPPFRMQKLLNANHNDIKALRESNFNLEGEKQELENNLEVVQKKNKKQEEEMKRLEGINKELRVTVEGLEQALSGSEDAVEMQTSRLQRELSSLRKENSSHNETVYKLMDQNSELTTTVEQLRNRCTLIQGENKRLEDEVSSLERCKRENEAVVEGLHYEVHDLKVGLQEAQRMISENCPGRINRTIEESFEGSFAAGASFSASPIHYSRVDEAENLGDVVIDKILKETQEQLAKISQDCEILTQEKIDLQLQMDRLIVECEGHQCDLNEVKNTNLSLNNQVAALTEEQAQATQLLMEASQQNQQLQGELKTNQEHVSNLQKDLDDVKLKKTEVEAALKEQNNKMEKHITLHTEQVEAFVKAAEEKEEELKKINEEFTQKILTKEQQTEAAQTELVNLREMSAKKEEEAMKNIEILNQKLVTTETEKTELEKVCTAQEGALNDLQEKVKVKISNMEKEQLLLQEKLENKVKECVQIKADFECKISKIEDSNTKELKEVQSNLECSRENISKLESNNKTLSCEIGKLSEEMSLKEKLVEDLNCKLKSTENNIIQLSEDLQEVKNSKSKLQTEKDDYIMQLTQQHKQELENLTMSHTEKLEEMNVLFVQKKKELEEMELHCKSEIYNREEETRSIKEQLTKDIEESKSTLSSKEEEIKLQKENMNELIKQHTNEITELSNQHHEKMEQLKSVHQNMVEAITNECTEKTQKLEQLHQNKLEMEEDFSIQIQEQNKKLKEQESQLLMYKEESANLSKDLKEAINSKQQVTEEKDNDITQLKSQHKQEMDKFSSLHNEKIEEMALQFDQKKQEMEVMEEQTKAMISRGDEEVSKLKDQLSKAEADHSSMKSAKEEIIQKLEGSIKQLTEQHTEEIAELSNQHQSKVDQLVTEHQEKLVYLDSNASERAQQLEQLQQLKIKNEEELAQKVEEKLKEINDLKSKLISSEEAAASLKKDLEITIDSKQQLEKEKDDIIVKISSLQEQMNSLNSLHSDKVKEMEEKIAQVNLVYEELEMQNKEDISKRDENINCLKDQLVKAEENHASILSDKEDQIRKVEESLKQLEQMHSEEVAKLSNQHQVNVEELAVKHKELMDNLDSNLTQKKQKLEELHAEEIQGKQEELIRMENKLKLLEETVKKESDAVAEKVAQLEQFSNQKEEEIALMGKENAKEVDDIKRQLELSEEKSRNYLEDISVKEKQINELNTTITEKEDLFKKQMEEIKKKLESEMSSSEAHILEMEKKIQTMESQHNEALTNLKDDINNQQKEYESQIEKVKINMSSVESEKSDLLAKLEKINDDFETNKETSNEVLKVKTEELNAVIDKINLEKKENDHKFTIKIEELSKEIDTVKEESEKVVLSLKSSAQAQQEIAEVEIGNMRYNINQLDKDKEILVTKVRNLEVERSEVESKVSILEHHFAEKTEKNTQLEVENSGLQTKVSTLEITLAQHQQELQEIQEKYSCLLREQEANRNKISMNLQQSSEQDSLLKTSHDTIAKLSKELETTKTESTVHKEKAKALELKIAVLESTFIDKEKDVISAREDILRTEREKDRTIESLKEQLATQQQNHRIDLKETIEKTTKRVKEKYQSELTNIISQTSEVEKSKQLLDDKYNIAKKKLGESIEENKELKRVNEEYQTQMSKAKEVMRRLKEKEKENSKQLETARASSAPLRAKVVELEKINKNLSTENKSLNAQVTFASQKMKEQEKQKVRESLGGNFVMEGKDSSNRRSSMLPSRRSLRPSLSDSSMLLNAGSTKGSSTSSEDERDSKISRRVPHRQRINSVDIANLAARATNKKEIPEINMPPPRRVGQMEETQWKAASRAISTESLIGKENVKETQKSTNSGGKRSSIGQQIPANMLASFMCEDEDAHEFNTKYMQDLQSGRCEPAMSMEDKRLSELQRRNSLYPPHMRSAYPAEMQFRALEDFTDDQLRIGYSRPGPPTPGKNTKKLTDKENLLNVSTSSISSRSSKLSGAYGATPLRSIQNTTSPAGRSLRGRSTSSPSVVSKKGKKGFTPTSLRKLMRSSKSPWMRLGKSEEISGRGATRPAKLLHRFNRDRINSSTKKSITPDIS